MQKKLLYFAVFSLLAVLGAVCLAWAAETSTGGSRSASLQQFRPQWKLGDAWVVETSSLPLQARADLTQMVRSRPIQWQFTVQKYEKIIADDCFRVVVRCLLPGPPQPVTVLWIDRKSQTLRQIQTQIPVAGRFCMMTEDYRAVGAQKSPVLGPLSALPIDLPLFQGNAAKGLESFSYEVNDGPAGKKKALGDVGFIYDVEQAVASPSRQHVKDLVPQGFTKDLDARPMVEVHMKSAGRQVQQLWQAGLPWPVYADNGTTISRLVKVIPGSSEPGK